ncbi:glutathione S-transferase family protein [Dyella jiangningensis]|uniref:glutathione S-transferase family protein n=1 Tax=Dyella jiangningensis TaxID=1379159 RepID=UPI0024109C64|nr:glutathione S-transferase family protein [Dyella jiangningensis]MDG2537363.1 glutathione S-transferase family protein [Dyella jiangningensis]
MELIGMLDSPYVRRTAISLRLLGIPFTHRNWSVFRNFDEFQQVNPLVKAPTLVLDDGTLLTESNLIIDWAQSISGKAALMPDDAAQRLRATRLVGIAIAASEKSVQIVYEHKREEDKRDAGWLQRVRGQLRSACDLLERELDGVEGWLFGNAPTQADVSIAVAWGFTQIVAGDVVDAKAYPKLAKFSQRAEQHPDFAALPPV